MSAWVHPCAFLAPSAIAFPFLQYFFGGSAASGESLLVVFQAAWKLQRLDWLVATFVAAVVFDSHVLLEVAELQKPCRGGR